MNEWFIVPCSHCLIVVTPLHRQARHALGNPLVADGTENAFHVILVVVVCRTGKGFGGEAVPQTNVAGDLSAAFQAIGNDDRVGVAQDARWFLLGTTTRSALNGFGGTVSAGHKEPPPPLGDCFALIRPSHPEHPPLGGQLPPQYPSQLGGFSMDPQETPSELVPKELEGFSMEPPPVGVQDKEGDRRCFCHANSFL